MGKSSVVLMHIFLSNLYFLKKETNNKNLKILAFCLPCVSQLPEAFRTWNPAQTALQTRSPLTGGHLSTGPFFLPFCKLCASLLRWVALPFYGLALHPKKLPCRRFATDDCFCRNRFLYRTWACSLDIRYGFLTKIKNTSPFFFSATTAISVLLVWCIPPAGELLPYLKLWFCLRQIKGVAELC